MLLARSEGSWMLQVSRPARPRVLLQISEEAATQIRKEPAAGSPTRYPVSSGVLPITSLAGPLELCEREAFDTKVIYSDARITTMMSILSRTQPVK